MLRSFESCYQVVSESKWTKPQDIVKTFNNSDLITCKKEKTSRIAFNVGHNKYRLITGYFFAKNQTILYVKFVGTHKEYDMIEVCEVDMFRK